MIQQAQTQEEIRSEMEALFRKHLGPDVNLQIGDLLTELAKQEWEMRAKVASILGRYKPLIEP